MSELSLPFFFSLLRLCPGCSCNLLREVPIHGKLYVTQNRVVFYSSIVKIVKVHVIYFPEIIAIETSKKEGLLNKNLEIQTSSSKHEFYFRKPRSNDIREAIVKIWMWHKDQKEKLEIPTNKVQEFYDGLYKNYNRDERKGEESESDEDEDEAAQYDSFHPFWCITRHSCSLGAPTVRGDEKDALETIPAPPEFNFPPGEVNPEFEPFPESMQ